ncbi:MAG: folate-binding protein [Betaproteobacteria bacterium]|nr:folate-binding protein [Betaproteobacteria bacterium]
MQSVPSSSPVPDAFHGNLCAQAALSQYGVLVVEGEDARAFLHAQLTNDVTHLAANQARQAGWCSAKGRLLATFLVVTDDARFLLLLARELAAPSAKRLSMFVLRSKVKIVDASEQLRVVGLWGSDCAPRLAALGLAPQAADLSAVSADGRLAVRFASDQYLLVLPAGSAAIDTPVNACAQDWTLREIRAGRPLITLATQEQFVPQMINLQAIGGIDFRKGCYPGQEIVARAQYRGQIKRRMARARAPAGVEVRPGQDLYSDDLPGQPSASVVNVAAAPEGSELLLVAQIATLDGGAPLRAAPGGIPLEILPLPYAV